jgi:polysaccharide biosynthesis transport protein
VDILQIAGRIARGVLRRRKRLLIICVLAAMAAFSVAALYVSEEPPRYKTSSLLLLEARPDRVPLFQEFSPFRPLPVQLAILRSNSLAQTVLETLPKSSFQDLVDNPYYVDWPQRLRNIYLRYTGREPEVESPQRRALTELQQARVGFEIKKDGIVVLNAEASKPQVALDIANTYIEALMARTRSFNVDDARVTREFLEQQLAEVKRSVTSSEQAFRTFMSANGGVKLPERSQAMMTQLSQAEATLAEIESSRKMLQARVEALRQKTENQKRQAASRPAPTAPVAPEAPTPDVARLRGQLVKLEGTLIEYRNKYTEEHPRVRLLKDRIAEIQNQLGDALKEAGPVVPLTAAVPPAERINFAEQLISLEASFHSVSAQEEATRKQVEALRNSLKGLSAGEMEYGRLTRETESNRSLHAMIADKLAAARIREQGEMRVVKMIDPPSPATPVMGGRRLKILMAAAAMSLLAGTGVPVAVEWLNKRIETAEDVEVSAGLPVLGLIPHIRSGRPIFASDYATTGSRASEQLMLTEAFRSLRVSVQLAMKIEGIRTLMVASPFAHEGKSTVVINLGLALAEVGTRVLIADSDLQRPMLHRTMKISDSGGGLVKALHSEQPLDAVVARVGDHLSLIPRGSAVYPHTRGMLATSRMRDLIQEMATKADLVICDSSPILLIPENIFLATAVDGVILVAKAGSTTYRDITRAKDALEGAGAKILGVVINRVPAAALRGHYNRHYYSYVRKDSR